MSFTSYIPKLAQLWQLKIMDILRVVSTDVKGLFMAIKIQIELHFCFRINVKEMCGVWCQFLQWFYNQLTCWEYFNFKSYLLANPSARPWCFISCFLKSSNPMVVLSPTHASSHIALVRSLNSLESKFIPFSSIEAFKASINSFWCNRPFPAINLKKLFWGFFVDGLFTFYNIE